MHDQPFTAAFLKNIRHPDIELSLLAFGISKDDVLNTMGIGQVAISRDFQVADIARRNRPRKNFE
jgi:hypothetical protein